MNQSRIAVDGVRTLEYVLERFSRFDDSNGLLDVVPPHSQKGFYLNIAASVPLQVLGGAVCVVSINMRQHIVGTGLIIKEGVRNESSNLVGLAAPRNVAPQIYVQAAVSIVSGLHDPLPPEIDHLSFLGD